MRKSKELKDDKYRVIKIGKEALFEFIYENIIDNQEAYFDISDGTKIISHFEMDYDNWEFIAMIRNSDIDDTKTLQFPDTINFNKLLKKMNDTTTTMFSADRYVELSLEEIENIQNKHTV